MGTSFSRPTVPSTTVSLLPNIMTSRVFHDEIQRRQAMLYPPYARLARLIVDVWHMPSGLTQPAAGSAPCCNVACPTPNTPPFWDLPRLQ